MCTLFLLTNITLDIDQKVKRHSTNGASQNTVLSTQKIFLHSGRHIVIRGDTECVT